MQREKFGFRTLSIAKMDVEKLQQPNGKELWFF